MHSPCFSPSAAASSLSVFTFAAFLAMAMRGSRNLALPSAALPIILRHFLGSSLVLGQNGVSLGWGLSYLSRFWFLLLLFCASRFCCGGLNRLGLLVAW